MKKGIHPKYYEATVTCITCGTTFKTGSTKPEIKVDTCSNCHPFYTGKQAFTSAAGQIDRFNKRYGIDSKAKKQEEEKSE
ncbi:MAG: 50S ribosomal protein L31 [Bacillales bacterium]|nr:50S ribosomal protein L31 [Bacillales bacterium]